MATDYWLSKMFYELQQPAAQAEYRKDRDAFLARYPLKPDVKAAVLADDVGTLSKLVNAYLLRFYFSSIGMKDPEFIGKLRALKTDTKETAHG
jgi:hypothetical protein